MWTPSAMSLDERCLGESRTDRSRRPVVEGRHPIEEMSR